MYALWWPKLFDRLNSIVQWLIGLIGGIPMEAKEGELWGQKGAFVQMDYPTMKSDSKEN